MEGNLYIVGGRGRGERYEERKVWLVLIYVCNEEKVNEMSEGYIKLCN